MYLPTCTCLRLPWMFVQTGFTQSMSNNKTIGTKWNTDTEDAISLSRACFNGASQFALLSSPSYTEPVSVSLNPKRETDLPI